MKIRVFPVCALGALALLLGLLMGCAKERPQDTSQMKEKSLTVAQSQDTARAWAEIGKITPEAVRQPVSPRSATAGTKKGLPRLVDLGRGKCIPCKMMAPILKEVELEYRGTAIVDVIDLTDDPTPATEYGIRVIPTQIFFDKSGAEVWRHEGFLAKEEIVKKLRELGADPIAK